MASDTDLGAPATGTLRLWSPINWPIWRGILQDGDGRIHTLRSAPVPECVSPNQPQLSTQRAKEVPWSQRRGINLKFYAIGAHHEWLRQWQPALLQSSRKGPNKVTRVVFECDPGLHSINARSQYAQLGLALRVVSHLHFKWRSGAEGVTLTFVFRLSGRDREGLSGCFVANAGLLDLDEQLLSGCDQLPFGCFQIDPGNVNCRNPLWHGTSRMLPMLSVVSLVSRNERVFWGSQFGVTVRLKAVCVDCSYARRVSALHNSVHRRIKNSHLVCAGPNALAII